jgi:hypothetical protein
MFHMEHMENTGLLVVARESCFLFSAFWRHAAGGPARRTGTSPVLTVCAGENPIQAVAALHHFC